MSFAKMHWAGIAVLSLGLTGMVASRAAAEEKGKEENEVKMKFDDVPKRVQKTIKREAFKAEVETVDKEEIKGKTVYEADARIGKNNYEIIVAEDGTLLSKKLDNEDEEKGDAREEHKQSESRESDEAHEGKHAKAQKKDADEEKEEADSATEKKHKHEKADKDDEKDGEKK